MTRAQNPNKNKPLTSVDQEHQGQPLTLLGDLEALAGQGLENVTARDILIPRIGILQALSPQVNKGRPEYIPGAGAGDICDFGTNEIIPAPMAFIPCYYVVNWLEWAPRNSNRGLVRIHTTPAILDAAKQDDRGRHVINGNYIAETAQFFGLNVSRDFRRCFISMTSTQLKKARRWVTLATSERLSGPNGTFTPPLFYRIYLLSTVTESNAEGTWQGWRIERGDPVTTLPNAKAVIEECKAFRNSLLEAKARADLGAMHEDLIQNDESKVIDSEARM